MKSTPTKDKISGKIALGVIMESDPSPSAEDRLNCFPTAASYKAELSGFTPGQDLDYWRETEAEFDEMEEH